MANRIHQEKQREKSMTISRSLFLPPRKTKTEQKFVWDNRLSVAWISCGTPREIYLLGIWIFMILCVGNRKRMNQRTGFHSTKSFICAWEAGSVGKKSLPCKFEDGRPEFNPLQPQKSPGAATHACNLSVGVQTG